MEFCQACQKNQVEIIEDCDDDFFPYELCKSCHFRLLKRALRPLEYFNLRARHGDTCLLQDDLYDNKTGIADQPDIEVDEDTNLKFPNLSEIKNDLEKAVDYAIVRFWLTEDIVQILRKFDKQSVLISLNERIKKNRNLAERIYEIVAKVLGKFAEDWTRKEWEFLTEGDFSIYAEMLAKCLPPDESFNYLTSELDKISSASKLNGMVSCLIYLQTEKSLDWIERNIHRMQSLSGSWGLVAASSEFSWNRAKEWLNKGRPLSLVAVDALSNLTANEENKTGAIWLRENPQRLLEPDSIENMNIFLESYLEKDNVPRTRMWIEYIKDNWNLILKM